ncbi:MAG: glycosyltransferase family 2 protein, partial [bacterium]|nr:glycosyltransferase family 2 protein [bacterium]
MAKTLNKKQTLAIILVNYNGSFWLKKTLTSLEEFYLHKSKNKVEVILVDNQSSDDSVAMTQENFPWVHLIIAEENFGFAKANNLALKETNADYVMLLNSDTQLDEKSNLDFLVDYLYQHKEAGMIGPKLLLTNGQVDPACHRGEPTLWASFTYFIGLEKLFPKFKPFALYHRSDLDLNTIHPVEAISGAAMMVARPALNLVGPLDENFFLYGEDLDWCKRFRDAGFSVIYDPEVTIIHHKNKSGIENANQDVKQKSNTYFYSTMLQYYDKHYQKKYPQFIRSLIKSF